jgi:hypothetical protein
MAILFVSEGDWREGAKDEIGWKYGILHLEDWERRV